MYTVCLPAGWVMCDDLDGHNILYWWTIETLALTVYAVIKWYMNGLK